MGNPDRRVAGLAAAIAMLGMAVAPRTAAVEVALDGAAVAPLKPGAPVTLALRLTDSATGTPARGYYPRAWLRPPLRPGESCIDVTGRLARFGAGPRQAIALDGVRLLVPAEDGSFTTVDPRLNLATANLVRVDRLGDAPPAAMALDPTRAVLWASYPSPGEIRRLDLAAGTVSGRLPFTGGPGELVVLPAQNGAVAVGLDAAGAVARIDAAGEAATGPRIGQGPVLLAAGTERLLALGMGDGQLTVLDPQTLEVRAGLSLGASAAALALVDGQDLALVAAGRDLEIVDIGRAGGVARATRIGRATLGIEADRLAVTADGRWVLALDRSRSVLAVVDLARGMRLAHALAFDEGAEELLVVRDAIFIRLRGAPTVLLVPVGSLETSEPVVERILMGSAPTGGIDRRLLVPAEGSAGFWLAHPADRKAYRFSGGSMRAADTSVPLKAGKATGLVLVPLAPQPLGGGRYAATIQAPRTAGSYLLAVAIDQVAEAHCLEVRVGAGGTASPTKTDLAALPLLQARLADGTATVGRDTVIRFTAMDQPIPADRPLAVRAFAQDGSPWQTRAVAEPAADSQWEVRLRFPKPGRYVVLTEAPAAGLRYEDGPRLVVDVSTEKVSP